MLFNPGDHPHRRLQPPPARPDLGARRPHPRQRLARVPQRGRLGASGGRLRPRRLGGRDLERRAMRLGAVLVGGTRDGSPARLPGGAGVRAGGGRLLPRSERTRARNLRLPGQRWGVQSRLVAGLLDSLHDRRRRDDSLPILHGIVVRIGAATVSDPEAHIPLGAAMSPPPTKHAASEKMKQ